MSTKYYRDNIGDFWKIEDTGVYLLSIHAIVKDADYYRKWDLTGFTSLNTIPKNWRTLIEITYEQFLIELI